MPSPPPSDGELEKLHHLSLRELPPGKQRRDELALDHVIQLPEPSGGPRDQSLEEFPLTLQRHGESHVRRLRELLRRPRQVPHTLHPSGHLLLHVGLHPGTCANAAAQKPVMRDNLKVRVLREHLPGPFLLALLHHQNTLGRLRVVAILGALLHQGFHPGQNSLELAGRRRIICKEHLEECLALVREDLGELLLHYHELRLHSHTVQEHGYRVTLGAPVLTVEDLVRAIHKDHLVYPF
mmetsp:Transcript_45839/g.79143  ORF Transcript_45839/g.79143 Transcript_45839/m.79143 type:complete len:238 (-) Transcript_45839:817-1530(-)